MPDDDLREHEGVSALLVCGVEDGRLTRWFRTHPAVDERIERFRALEAGMERGV